MNAFARLCYRAGLKPSTVDRGRYKLSYVSKKVLISLAEIQEGVLFHQHQIVFQLSSHERKL